MKKISISELQNLIKNIDHKNNAIDKYFYKLSEEVEKLAQAIRKNRRLSESESIKGTIEKNFMTFYIIPFV